MSGLIDTTNLNNHASVKRLEASEKADAVLKVINEYRLYIQRFETIYTWDVFEFLRKLEKKLYETYEEELVNGERDKLREEYFMKVGKKPFLWWSVEQLREEIKRYEEESKPDLKYLKDKKSRWQKKN